jgi:primosomal protein N' (replication factor Y)
VVLKSESELRLERAAAGLAAALRETFPADTDLLGPAPMFRVRGKYRRRLLTKAQDRGGTVASIRAAVERMSSDRLLKDVAIGVDVDPQ